MADTKSIYVLVAVFLVLGAAIVFVLMQKPEVRIPLNKEFSLKEGESVLVEDIEMRFIRVVADSRCPVGVQCVWAGEVVAEIEVGNRSQSYGLYNLSSLYSQKGGITVKGYTILLLKVEPERKVGQQLKDYKATFVVMKENVTSFESCLIAGYPIMESYPRQCRTSDGKVFVEEVATSCLKNSDCTTGFCRAGECTTFQPSFSCSSDSDCILINQEHKLNCCWEGACEPLDYSKESWIAVNKQWLSSEKELYCPPKEQCGPAPACAASVVNNGFEARCIEKKCEKIRSMPYDVQASPGEEFVLKIGETASIKSYGIYVKLGDVPRDSRCPVGVQCVWAGEAVAVVEVYQSSVLVGVYELSTLYEEKKEALFNSYFIKLAEVEPPKQPGKEIAKEEYRLMFVVGKKQ